MSDLTNEEKRKEAEKELQETADLASKGFGGLMGGIQGIKAPFANQREFASDTPDTTLSPIARIADLTEHLFKIAGDLKEMSTATADHLCGARGIDEQEQSPETKTPDQGFFANHIDSLSSLLILIQESRVQVGRIMQAMKKG